MRKALIVIDVQNYFLNPHTKNLPRRIASYIQKHGRKFDLIIFTNFVNNPGSNSYRLLNWKECLKSPAIDLADGLKSVLSRGLVVPKDVLSALKVPKVKNLLKRKKITNLYLCGIDTDCCVLATAYDAFDEGYKITILKKLSMTHTGRNLHQAALRMVEKNIGSTLP